MEKKKAPPKVCTQCDALLPEGWEEDLCARCCGDFLAKGKGRSWEVCVACDALLIGDQKGGGPLCPQCRHDAAEMEGDWKDELGTAKNGVQDIKTSVRGLLHVMQFTEEGGEKKKGVSVANAHVVSTFMMGVMSKLYALEGILGQVEELVEERIVAVEERRLGGGEQ